jgi:serine/threonine protein kinase
MGDACSTQRTSTARASVLAVPGQYPEGQDHRLNEGRRFQDEYDVSTRLARNVSSVRNKITQATYVAYTLRKSDEHCKDPAKVVSSIKRLQSLDHPNICRLLEAFDDRRSATGQDFARLIYEKAIGLPLLKYVAQHGCSEVKAANLVQQVARALKHGDECGVCHGAVVPKNIFVSSIGKVVMTDFGLAYLLKPSPLEDASEENFSFLPPEALQPWFEEALAHTDAWGRQREVHSMPERQEGSTAWKKEHLRKDFWASAGDMWSLGVVLFRVLRGYMPFQSHGKGVLGLVDDVINHKLDIRLDVHGVLSDEASNVLMALLAKDPANRPSSEELLQHKWLVKNMRTSAAPLKKGICTHLSTFISETHFKKLVMRMLVTKMAPRRLVELQQAFDSMDANQDGQVTLLELKRGLSSFPEICEGLRAPIEDIFAAIDVDNGGKVSLHEFLAATLDAHDVMTDSVIVEAFRCLDTNGDGRLCKEELAVAVREIDGQLGASHVEDLMCKLEEELGPDSLVLRDFVDLMKEEGKRETRSNAVAREAESRSWGWCPCAVQRSRVERVVAAVGQRSPSPRPVSRRPSKDSRSPKGSPHSSRRSGRGGGESSVVEADGCSPKVSSRSGRRSGRRSSSKSPAPDAEAKAGLRRMSQHAELAYDDDTLLQRCRCRSPAASDCSTRYCTSPHEAP